MRLSNRDLVLVIGIVVAVVITLTAIVYKDQLSATKKDLPKKISHFIDTHSSGEHFRLPFLLRH